MAQSSAKSTIKQAIKVVKSNVSILLISSIASAAVAQEVDPYTVDLYTTYCEGCHTVPGANIPIAFSIEDWEQRLKKGRDTLVDSAINGMGNMPPQGLCQECTYQDFEDLIDYMASPKS